MHVCRSRSAPPPVAMPAPPGAGAPPAAAPPGPGAGAIMGTGPGAPAGHHSLMSLLQLLARHRALHSNPQIPTCWLGRGAAAGRALPAGEGDARASREASEPCTARGEGRCEGRYLLRVRVRARARARARRQGMCRRLARARATRREMQEAMSMRVGEKQRQRGAPRPQSHPQGSRFPGSAPADLHGHPGPDQPSSGAGAKEESSSERSPRQQSLLHRTPLPGSAAADLYESMEDLDLSTADGLSGTGLRRPQCLWGFPGLFACLYTSSAIWPSQCKQPHTCAQTCLGSCRWAHHAMPR